MMMTLNLTIVFMSTVFANVPVDRRSIFCRVIRKNPKNGTYAALLNTQHYKVRIKGKVEQSKEGKSTLPIYIDGVAIEKGALGSPLIKVYFTFIYINSV